MEISTLKKSAKNNLKIPSIKWVQILYCPWRNVFLRRQNHSNLQIYPHYVYKSLVAKSQHFSWKIYSIAEQPIVLTPHGCLQTQRSANDWHKLQAAACNQAGPFYSFWVFFSLSRAHLTAWMGAQRKADGNTICSRSNSRGRQHTRWMASSNHESSLIQLYLIA